MSVINLTFRNNSQDIKSNTVVMFHKNTDASPNQEAIAWKVIEHCPIDGFHPFLYPLTQQISLIDAWGNFSAMQDANNGDVFSVTAAQGSTGTILAKTHEIGDPNMITVRNDLAIGSIDIVIFKDKRQLAISTGVTPGAESVFKLKPSLFIGTCTDVMEGDVMNSHTVQSILTQISLLGLKSADISMSGGGTGPQATALAFALQAPQYC